MIQFLIVFALLLVALWKWDSVETFAMNIGEKIEDIRDAIAFGQKPYGDIGILVGGAFATALAITLLL